MKTYPRAIQAVSFGDVAEDATNEVKALNVSVLCHSIAIERMSWLDVYKASTTRGDGSDPGDGDATVYMKWLQYKLNELGYLAGPLTGVKDAQTKRALCRYTVALIGKESDDEKQNNIRARIANGDNSRADLIETPAAITDRMKATRILLDHDFCVTEAVPRDQAPQMVAGRDDGHVAWELTKLDRFELPLKVTIQLVSKEDRTGYKKGVPAPEATGPVKIEWHVFDPPEDFSVIGQEFLGAPDDVRTKSAAYLLAAQGEVAAGDVEDSLRAYDNCPASLGGVRPADAEDMTPYFRANGITGVYEDETSGKKFLTKARVAGGAGILATLPATTGVLFRGSYIAGDNWAVQARLSFEGVDQKAAVIKAHKALTRLAGSFDKYEPNDPLAAQTGKMTLWRRHHVAAVVDWWTNKAPKAINWDIIVAAFRAAHIVLVRPPGAPQSIATLINPGRSDAYRDEVVRILKAGYFNGAGRTPMWNDTGIIPIQFPTRRQNDKEEFGTYRDFAINVKQTIAHFAAGHYGTYRIPADFVREWLGPAAGPGQIILRFDHLPEPDVRASLNNADQKRFDKKQLDAKFPYYKTDEKGDGGPSIGVSGGVTMIEHQHSKQFAASFLLAHEMGHNYFLTHPVDPGKAKDHDTGDMNCVMHYPSQTSELAAKGWGTDERAGKPVPLFCGKCLLKLRGWQVRSDDLPASS